MKDPGRGSRSRRAAGALLLVALGAGGWLVVNSPIFAVDDITVRGASHVAAEEIRILARIEDGQNLIRLAMDEVAARIERHPWIARAELSRDLPSTLVVEVRERRPRGWLAGGEGDAGTAVVVAGDGTVLDRPATEPRDLPLLGELPEAPDVGVRLAVTPAELRVTASMPASLLRAVAAVTVVAEDATLRLRGGGAVEYGPPSSLVDKHRALEDVLAWAEDRRLEIGSIDVTVPSAPTLQPARGGAPVAVPGDLVPSPSPTP